MKSADFDYDLPDALIAQHPAARRDASRLLVVDRAARRIEHRAFTDLPDYIERGDCLVRNVARVLPARIFARRPSGGRVECLLLRPHADAAHVWWCLLRPGRKLPRGATFERPGEFTAHVVEKTPSAEYLVNFEMTRPGETVPAMAERLGRLPLPPYIHRADGIEPDPDAREDAERYQTVFADPARTVAVAAPTAGLHFTPEILKRISTRGAEFADVVLHVGLGTFRPIETEDVESHPIHREWIEVPAAARSALAAERSGRRIAVGTTAVRTIEFYARNAASGVGGDGAFRGEADLYLHPPCEFRLTQAMVTNFHLPRSTLLCLVAGFLAPGSTEGVAWLREIYAEAVRERYRFLSYGDAMLIL